MSSSTTTNNAASNNTTTVPPPPPSPNFSIPAPRFPPHNSPRVWFLTSGHAPVAVAVARQVLAHGDYIVACLPPEDPEPTAVDGFKRFLLDVAAKGWKARVRVVGCDVRIRAQCQAGVAEAVEAFGGVDILLCCTSEALVGTVEELAATPRTRMLVRDQFESSFFGPVNIIKASLPALRERKNGHIIVLTGITSHLGTPGLSMYCAAGWALEGFCDSLAYEIAPFNIKLTIVQPNIEVAVLSNRLLAAPQLAPYAPDANPAPLSRELFARLLRRMDPAAADALSPAPGEVSGAFLPRLSDAVRGRMLAETVHALTAIGGHDNPPARLMVGHEDVASVKEKLKTVSEELEDFVDCTSACDVEERDGAGTGGATTTPAADGDGGWISAGTGMGGMADYGDGVNS